MIARFKAKKYLVGVPLHNHCVCVDVCVQGYSVHKFACVKNVHKPYSFNKGKGVVSLHSQISH